MTVATYLERKYNLTQTPYKRSNEQGFYLVNGEWIAAEIHEALNKLPITLFGGRENPDKRKAFLY